MQTRNSFMLRKVYFLLSVLCLATAVPAQDNYIRTYIPRTELPPGDTPDTNNSTVSTSYYDAAGRLIQTVKHSFTPQRNDQANFIDYDGLGRKTREWSYLPFDEADGSYRSREKFVDSPHAGNHYVDYEYEPVAYHRITGEIGRNASSRGVHKEYLFNTNVIEELSVWYFKPYTFYSDRLEKAGKYPDGSLSCVKTTDEDGNVGYVFTDAQNRPVLERRMNGGSFDTYYVYNDWNQLIAVLPPALAHQLSNGGQTQTYYTAINELFSGYAYLYKYDIQNHRVGVKLPGADWHYTVYDGDHRPVFEQDGCQRPSGEWTFYKYDGLGRVILEGVCKGFSLDNMIREYADKLVKEEYTGNTSPTSFGYSENVRYPYPPAITKVYYYDTYDFLSLPLFADWLPEAPRKWSYPGTSLQTGSYVRCLEEAGHELCSFYYDHRARNTRTDKSNSISRVYTQTHQSYTFCNGVNQTRTFWVGQNDECYRSISNLYDYGDRLRTSFYYVTYAPASQHFKAVLRGDLLNYEYDEFGRIKNKILFDRKDTVSYSYDSRSRLEQIRNRNFSERLYYDNGSSGPFFPNSSICHNGQINNIWIKQGNETYGYRLRHDGLNRLTESRMYKVLSDTVISALPLPHREEIEYDMMGNIRRLHQVIDNEVVNHVTIYHTGNQLSGISRESDYTVSAKYVHLAHKEYQGRDGYMYDANGNETKNLSGGIYYSRFNKLNLPDSVLFDKSGNTTLMSYLADGKRIRTVHKTYSTGLSYLLDNVRGFNDPIHTTEEIRDGDLLFKDGMLTRIDLPCGYINVREPVYDKMTAYYFVTDHLGSVRTTVAADSREVVQQLEYTPSGSLWRSYDKHALQPKHFCGKEELTMHGYNMHDSGARFHTGNGIRFISIDPLAEKYYAWSPYAYCMGNPVNAVDPTGKYVESAWDIASLAMGVKSFVSNVKGGNVIGAVVDGVGIVLDAAAVALPVPGGAGAAIKGVRAIDKAVDIAKTTDKAADGVSAMKRGIQNEAKVLESIGEVKNTAKKTVNLPGTGEKITVIPDAINDTKFIEIKDVKSLSNTKQIRGERQAAAVEGKDFTIITGDKTHVSGNIPTGEITRRKDIGPQ